MAIIELSLCNGQLFSLRLGPNGTNYNQLKDHPHRNNTAPARCLSARRESRRDECKLADYCVKVLNTSYFIIGFMHQLIFVQIRWRQLQLHQLTGKCSQMSNKLITVWFDNCLLCYLLYMSHWSLKIAGKYFVSGWCVSVRGSQSHSDNWVTN